MHRPESRAAVVRRFSGLAAVAGVALGTLASTPAQAQLLPHFHDLRVRQMDYRNSSGERGATIFSYGRDGVLRSALWRLEDRSRHSCNFHLYDAAGREVEKYREFSDGMTSRELYEYDEDGRRVAEHFERSDGVAGTGRFHWDDQGRLVATDCDRYKGWLSARIAYSYDGELRTGATISRDGLAIGEITYEYDTAGHLEEETWRLGDWSQVFSYDYEAIPARVYNFSNPLFSVNPRFVVSSEAYDFNGEVGGPSHYTYDVDGRLVEKVFERSDGLTTVTTFEYDENGSLTSSHRDYPDGSFADFLYGYDDALRLTDKTFTRSDGEAGFERYTYDRLGRLETARYRNMDFWLNGTITFSYDDWGRLGGGQFAGEDGFDADIEIRTDDDGNVTRVHWDFSFGKSQTYTLAYRPIDARSARGDQ